MMVAPAVAHACYLSSKSSKTRRWVPRSAKSFEPFSCSKGFTRQKVTIIVHVQ